MMEAMSARDGVIRLADGEDLVAKLLERPWGATIIYYGIGMLRGLELGYWSGTEYVKHHIDEPVELLSLQGNLGERDHEAVLHAHVCVAKKDGTAWGGHLLAATVHNTVELAVVRPAGIQLVRKQEATGLLGIYPQVK